MFTARIGRYPTPHFLNWGVDYESEWAKEGSHMAKMAVVEKYLSTLPDTTDDELVLLVDAWDIWFQLPIELFLQRYHTINARANERISNQIGAERMDEQGVPLRSPRSPLLLTGFTECC